ncbi:MAG: FKBP-type peptidyl-prolyl cis-trans isomerase [Dermatophilaceae bacterium]
MRSSTRVCAVLGVCAGLVLVGCSSTPSGPATPTGSATTTQAVATPSAADRAMLDTIQVVGADPTAGTDPVAEPTVTLTKKPVSVSTTTVKVLRPGTGVLSKTGDKVTVRQVLYLGNEGVKLDSSYGEKQPATFTLSGTDMIPGLISALTGVQKGSRILFVIPPAQAFGTRGRTEIGISGTDNLVVVADVVGVTTPKPVLEKAEGTVIAPPAGLPTVTFDDATGPSVTMPKTTPPADTVQQLLIEGNGDVVTVGQEITVHYYGALWKDGKVFDSSWQRKTPATFVIGIGKVVKGWDATLVGKKVGSRVLLVIPPKDGYGASGRLPAISGTDTMVFVVDILGASSSP